MSSSVSWNTKSWDKMLSRCRQMHGSHVKIGIQGSVASAKHDDEGDMTNAQVAAVHEFSTPQDTPPGRPFIRPVYDADPNKWKHEINEACGKVLNGANPTAELRRIGETYRKEVISRMKAGISPPLAESTIARRKGQTTKAKREKLEAKGKLDATPLIDTGTLMGSISVVVAKD